MKKEEEILVEGGLTEDESIRIQHSPREGCSKASQVAKWTGINRTLVYKALDSSNPWAQ
jgi:DNA-binding phage protein